MKNRVYLSSPHMGGEELKFIQDAFNTNWVAPAGPHLERFEGDLINYAGVNHCVALASGTAAIHLALIVLGVSTGDEVLCSTFTFAGTCNPVIYQGATPVFIESEAASWNLDPFVLEEAILDRIRKKKKKPKAIIPVHLYGVPARMDKIMEVAQKYEIPVIEDAAEGLGSLYLNKKLGSFGDMSVFSFNGNKIITTSGGGALLSRNERWITHARFLSQQARDPAPHYQHSQIGYNYRLSNVCAAIGRGQMQVLDERVKKRRENFEFYKQQLNGVGEISFQPEPSGSYSNRWLTSITLGKPGLNEKIRMALEAKNIESRPLWKPMHCQPIFKDAPYYGNELSNQLFQTGLCLPSGSNLTEEVLAQVVDEIRQTVNKSS